MATTALHPTALPGKPYGFSPKTPAAGGGHTGDFTRLSVLGVPGGIHAFSPKDPATGGAPHSGDFTRLSVLGVPGGIHFFTAKTEAIEEPALEGGRGQKRRDPEEEELLILIQAYRMRH